VVTEAVNDTLKAISASLLMEQVLAPRFNFRTKNQDGEPKEGFDYGDDGYKKDSCNVGYNEDTGQLDIEIKGLKKPATEQAQRICNEDINEVITAFVQDKQSIERGMFDEEIVPEELTQIKLGKIIKDKYPELDEDDLEAVREHAVAALNLTQKGKKVILDKIENVDDKEEKQNTALVAGVRKFVLDVKNLDIDLIDSVNPFSEAYAILSKTMTEERLREVAALITGKKIQLNPDEARDLARRALKFLKERGRLPSLTSPDAWEKKMAEGVEYMKRMKEESANE
jgi:hypothetical protein